MSSASDLTARARIRDAAVTCFGQRGFDVSVRVIAEYAGVSPGLVIHHFGSKERLREVCDEHVRQVITEIKSESALNADSQLFLRQLAEIDRYAPLLGYLLNALRAGGPLASAFFDDLAEDAERYLALGVEAGTMNPSRDPAARARFATSTALGSLLLHVNLHHRGPDIDFGAVFREWTAAYMLPALEMYSEPLLADRSIFEGYLEHLETPSTDPSAPGAPPAPDTSTDT
ncbi:TetR family transcriptional regulator [Nocardiopsis oceani]